MPARLFRVIVPVQDIELAASFYAGVLGSPGRRVSPGRHYFDGGGVIVACFDARADGDPETFSPNPEWMYFAVDDLEATLAAVAAGGGRPAPGDIHDAPAGQIVVRPWGERSVYCLDPFGNKLCLVDPATVFRG